MVTRQTEATFRMRASLTLLLICTVACGGSPPSNTAPLAPEAPAPPTSECPPHWQPAEGGLGCEPWAAGESIECPDGEARFPSHAACEPLFIACPAGEYAADLPATNVRYVSQGAAPDGDGSVAHPFDSITRALEGAAPGAVIAVGAGTFTVPSFLELGPELSLVGACAARTTIRSEHIERGRPFLRIRSGTVRLHGLTLAAPLIAVASTGPGTMTDLRDLIVEAPTSIALFATDGARITGGGVLVRDVRPGSDGKAAGITVTRGGIVELMRIRIERVSGFGVLASDPGSRVALTDSHIRDIRLDQTSGSGHPASANSGSEIVIERSLVESGFEVGLKFGGVDTRGTLRDVVVRDIEMRSGMGGAGIAVGAGATLDATRVLVARTPSSGVYVLDANASLHDLVIRDVQAASTGSTSGIAILRTSQASLARVALVNIPGIGLVTARGARTSAEDVSIARTTGTTTMPYGPAILASEQAELDLARARLEDNSSGMIIATHSMARLRDIDVRSSSDDDDDRRVLVGVGLEVAETAHVSLDRANFDGMRGEAILVQDFPDMTTAPSSLIAADVSITHTAASAYAESGAYGSALVVAIGAYARVSRFRFSENAFCGVRVLEDGTADLSDGEISRNEFGADVDTDGFDVARIYDRVSYLDNTERNAVVRTGRPPPTIALPSF